MGFVLPSDELSRFTFLRHEAYYPYHVHRSAQSVTLHTRPCLAHLVSSTPCSRFLRRPSAVVSVRVSTSLLALPVQASSPLPPFCSRRAIFAVHAIFAGITTWRPQVASPRVAALQDAHHPSPRGPQTSCSTSSLTLPPSRRPSPIIT